MLAPIKQGQLRKDAAAAWNAMNQEARSLGVELLPTGSKSSYRTYAQQVELYALYKSGRGNLAAVPGSSNHGYGTAVDLATEQMRTMLDRIGAKYGYSKQWSDAKREWWHILYQAGHWSGPDPGPDGSPAAPPAPKPVTGAITSVVNADGRIETFTETPSGEVLHAFQTKVNGPWGRWRSLGTPGAR